MQSNAEVAEYHFYLPMQLTKSLLNTRYFSLATLSAEYIGQASSNLKLLRSTE